MDLKAQLLSLAEAAIDEVSKGDSTPWLNWQEIKAEILEEFDRQVEHFSIKSQTLAALSNNILPGRKVLKVFHRESNKREITAVQLRIGKTSFVTHGIYTTVSQEVMYFLIKKHETGKSFTPSEIADALGKASRRSRMEIFSVVSSLSEANNRLLSGVIGIPDLIHRKQTRYRLAVDQIKWVAGYAPSEQ